MCAAAARPPASAAACPPPLFVRDCAAEEDTARLGAALARLARRGDIFCLEGPLGGGKTVLARGFVRQAAGPATEVPSPTFNIVLTYPAAPAPVWHFDLYRIADPDELWELGLEEAFAEGISLIEWPERLGGQLPPEALRLRLETSGAGGRRISAFGGAAWAARLRDLDLG